MPPRALPRGHIERLLSRRDVPLREKTLWRMLYETAACASEVLALNGRWSTSTAPSNSTPATTTTSPDEPRSAN